ncbi:MAG: serine/threonine protein kinase [Candidatus Obscuribacterales bacterium]
MEEPNTESCQKCLQPLPVEGAQATTQWVSSCRCNRTYSPNVQFSIDLCTSCKKRVPAQNGNKVKREDLCACDNPNPITVANYIKQNETDKIELDLASLGLSPESFPAERYQPLGILGIGSRADVILARDKQRGTKVAVKCYKKISPEALRLFEQEMKKLSRLTHTNIAKITDFGILNKKTPYVVTEYKDGFNIEQCLDLHGIPSYDVAVMILIGVCEALVYALKEGYPHTDIRPGNIIFLDDMNSEPSIVVTDFSPVKLEMHRDPDSPADALYMSSDEARNLDPDERAEIYTIGAVGFALLTGRAPFDTGSFRDLKNKHALELPPRISSLKFEGNRPKDLEEIIERCLEKDPRVRFDSIAKLMERLEVFPNRVKAKIAALEAARKKQKLIKISAIALAVAVAGAIGFFVLGGH